MATHQRIRVRVANSCLSLLNWCLGNVWRKQGGLSFVVWGDWSSLDVSGNIDPCEPVSNTGHQTTQRKSQLFLQENMKATCLLWLANHNLSRINQCWEHVLPWTCVINLKNNGSNKLSFKCFFQFLGNKPNKGYFPVKNSGIPNVVILNSPKRFLKKVQLVHVVMLSFCMTAWKYKKWHWWFGKGKSKNVWQIWDRSYTIMGVSLCSSDDKNHNCPRRHLPQLWHKECQYTIPQVVLAPCW